jgi:hypothetical protein
MDSELTKFRTPKPRSFHFSHFRSWLHKRFGALELTKFRTPKPRNAGPTFSFSHFFGSLFMLDVWHLKPRNPESRNPEVLVPHPFTFRNSGVVVCCCLVVETPKPRIPKSRSVGPTSFHLFRIRSCCVLLFGLKTPKPRIPKSFHLFRSVVPHPFTFFSEFGSVVCCCLVVETPKPRIPKSRSVVPHPFTFSEFRELLCVVVW